MRFSLLICALVSLISITSLIEPWPAELLDKLMFPLAILCIGWITLEILPRVLRALIRDESARQLAIAFVVTIGICSILGLSSDMSDKEISNVAYIAVISVLLGTVIIKRLIIRYARKSAEKKNGQNSEKV